MIKWKSVQLGWKEKYLAELGEERRIDKFKNNPRKSDKSDNDSDVKYHIFSFTNRSSLCNSSHWYHNPSH